MQDLTQLNKHPLNQRAKEFLTQMKEPLNPRDRLYLHDLMIAVLTPDLPDSLIANLLDLNLTKLMKIAEENLTVKDLSDLTPRQAGIRIAEQVGIDLTNFDL